MKRFYKHIKDEINFGDDIDENDKLKLSFYLFCSFVSGIEKERKYDSDILPHTFGAHYFMGATRDQNMKNGLYIKHIKKKVPVQILECIERAVNQHEIHDTYIDKIKIDYLIGCVFVKQEEENIFLDTQNICSIPNGGKSWRKDLFKGMYKELELPLESSIKLKEINIQFRKMYEVPKALKREENEVQELPLVDSLPTRLEATNIQPFSGEQYRHC
ncbi:hypothetical protein [Wolbachia endosymbiont of Pentidionis agamae]|uniref:hypothetical protein n=1 Tax=Wolbachia endosymbiont of Pentidionis agamae TaxID=3110435 RepID=UPI002FD6340D